MNINLLENIRKDIKKYSTEKSKYNPIVTTRKIKKIEDNPIIVIQEENNSTSIVDTTFLESIDDIDFSINIYSKDISLGNEIIPNIEVARDLMAIVDRVMFRVYKMKRKSAKPTPNLDNSIYRITMVYSKKILI